MDFIKKVAIQSSVYIKNHYLIFVTILLIILAYTIYQYIDIDMGKKEVNPFEQQTVIKKKYYYDKIKENQQSIEKVDQTITDEQRRIQYIKACLSLKELYFDGVPDKYDIHGAKIRGVPPNPALAIYYLNQAINCGYLQGWIEMGQMYHYGFYNFPSNLDKAEEIYLHVVNNIDDYELANQAYQLYQEARDENHRIFTHQWLNLPYTTTIQPKKTKYELSQHRARPRVPQNNTNLFIGRWNDDDNDVIDINHLFRADRDQHDVVPIDQNQNQNQNQTIKNDMHNVHDHAVIATIKNSVEELKKNTVLNKSQSECLIEMRQYLGSLPESDKRNDALTALDTIEKSYLPLSFTDLKEVDVLTLVWNRIHSDIHQNNAKNLKENLVDELAECIEHDKPVCQTGRITRLVDTLNVIDPVVTIKPTFMIDQEMMDKAGHLRDESYNQLTEQQKSDVDALAPNNFQKQWTQQLKENIRKQLSDDYVQTGVMLENTFNQSIEKWIDEI